MSLLHGYQDFVRTSEWVDEAWLVEADNAATTLGALTYGPFFVGHWHSIDFFANAIVRDHEFVIQWANDEDFSGGVTTERYRVRAGNMLHVAIPNRQRWVQVIAVASGATPVHTIFASLTNRQMQLTNTPAYQPLLDYDNQLIGVGATVTKYASWTHPGKVRFALFAPQTCVAAFYTEGLNGNSPKLIYSQAFAVGTYGSAEFYLTSSICKCSLTNTSAVGAQFYLTLIPVNN